MLGENAVRFDVRLKQTYKTWTYLTQHGDTDFEFICRQLEHEGIFFWFEHAAGGETMVLADHFTCHQPFPGYASVPFYAPGEARATEDHFDAWRLTRQVETGQFERIDYDFTKPRTDLTTRFVEPRGHLFDQYQRFAYPGDCTELPNGNSHTANTLERLQAEQETVLLEGRVRGAAPGYLFSLTEHPRGDQNRELMITAAQPWADSHFGAIHLPRIGQEVIVDFEHGDPNRPIITGRVHNAAQMPPWALPANKTQSGFLTRSSLGGSAANANAIHFEDLKGAERLWIHAERNQGIEVEPDETHWVGMGYRMNVGLMMNTVVGMNQSAQIGENQSTTVGTQYSLKVGGGGEGGAAAAADGVMNIFAPSGSQAAADGFGSSITTDAESITLNVGQSTMVMKADGTVSVNGKNIALGGSGHIGLDAPRIDLN